MRSDSVTAVGAVVVGLLGNLYSRLIGGQAYPAMVPGVLFLVPVRTDNIFDLLQLKVPPLSPVFLPEARNHILVRTSLSEYYKVGAFWTCLTTMLISSYTVSIGITTGFGISNYLIYAGSWGWVTNSTEKKGAAGGRQKRKGPKEAIFAF